MQPSPESRLIVVHDQRQPCPYLADTVARMPLRMPIGRINPASLDRLLELGYRRSGAFLYRAQCPGCQACEPTRVLVDSFTWTASMRRVLGRGDRELQTQWGPPQSDLQRLRLFNHHRQQRSLDQGEQGIDLDGYQAFLVASCCETVELAIHHQETLVAIALVDVGQNSLSAVYTHFDPAYSRYSLGTYAVLQQIRRAHQSGRRFVYLGMYVAANRHLNYKARFQPQQRLVAGQWAVP